MNKKQKIVIAIISAVFGVIFLISGIFYMDAHYSTRSLGTHFEPKSIVLGISLIGISLFFLKEDKPKSKGDK